MIAILAEDVSDANSLKAIIRARLGNISTKTKGYSGGGNLLNSAARDVKYFAGERASQIVICKDADERSYSEVETEIQERVVAPSGYSSLCCVVVPVQELESWLIADELAVREVIESFEFDGHASPETIQSPKEWLIKKSRQGRTQPLYSPKTFNEKVAAKLRHEVVAKKCPSFKRFLDRLSAK